jgi:hypothetical protein
VARFADGQRRRANPLRDLARLRRACDPAGNLLRVQERR